MGHLGGREAPYVKLQQRLDKTLTGAPDSPTFQKILRLLFTAQEADLARRIPMAPTALGPLARALCIPEKELAPRLEDMARRGLVVDFEMGAGRYFVLAPVVIGFFEFTFMRARDELPMAEIAKLFHEYMLVEDRFSRSVFAGQTQLFRTAVREDTLPAGDHIEIADWERASAVVSGAKNLAVSLCACRHKAAHLGEACEREQSNCLSFDHAAITLVRNGLAEEIDHSRGQKLIEEAREGGMCHTLDNVKREVSFLCNCCRCCCGVFRSIRGFGLGGNIVSSNFVAEADDSRCKGCRACEKACPVDALTVKEVSAEGAPAFTVAVGEGLCVGCGLCAAACRPGALFMKARAKRVFTPEDMFDQMVHMAVERGKLADLVFGNPNRLSHRALGRVFRVLENTAPARALLAVGPLRSVFLKTLVGAVRWIAPSR